MLPYWSGRSIALGIWFRHVVKNLPDYMVDDQWLSPKLVPTTIDEIAEWDPIDEEEDVQAAEENESGAPRQTDREGEDTGDTGSLRGTGDVEWDLDELPSPLPPAG